MDYHRIPKDSDQIRSEYIKIHTLTYHNFILTINMPVHLAMYIVLLSIVLVWTHTINEIMHTTNTTPNTYKHHCGNHGYVYQVLMCCKNNSDTYQIHYWFQVTSISLSSIVVISYVYFVGWWILLRYTKFTIMVNNTIINLIRNEHYKLSFDALCETTSIGLVILTILFTIISIMNNIPKLLIYSIIVLWISSAFCIRYIQLYTSVFRLRHPTTNSLFVTHNNSSKTQMLRHSCV